MVSIAYSFLSRLVWIDLIKRSVSAINFLTNTSNFSLALVMSL